MEDTELTVMEGRIRKTILKAGALAGVSAVATVITLAALLGLIRWGWIHVQENAEASRMRAIDQENAKVSPVFLAAARRAGDMIRSEHGASSKGWKIFKPTHESAASAIDQLENSAKTSHERVIAEGLRNTETLFNLCVEGAIEYSYSSGLLSDCEKGNPVSEIDTALK